MSSIKKNYSVPDLFLIFLEINVELVMPWYTILANFKKNQAVVYCLYKLVIVMEKNSIKKILKGMIFFFSVSSLFQGFVRSEETPVIYFVDCIRHEG